MIPYWDKSIIFAIEKKERNTLNKKGQENEKRNIKAAGKGHLQNLRVRRGNEKNRERAQAAPPHHERKTDLPHVQDDIRVRKQIKQRKEITMKATALQNILETAFEMAQDNNNDMYITVTMKSGYQYKFNYGDNDDIIIENLPSTGLLQISNAVEYDGKDTVERGTAWLDIDEIESVAI